jgi:uncharacterized cupredoxin-like copper-binding protein
MNSALTKTAASIGSALFATALLAACGSSSKSGGGATTTSAGGGLSVTTVAGATTIGVDLSDTKGTNGPETMTLDNASAKTGKITFSAKNTGTIKHEAVILKLSAGQKWDTLPVDASTGEISEAGSVGEVGDVEIGKTGTVTLDLKPGDYVVVCNIKDHYKLGMRAGFTVTP